MTAKFNADILGRLGDASLDEINAALAAIRSEGEALQAEYAGKPATQDSVQRYTTLLEAAKKLHAERTSRAALADAQAAQFAEMDGLTAPEPADVSTTGEPATAPASPAPAAGEGAPDPTDPATVDPAGQSGDGDGDKPAEPEGDGNTDDTGEGAVTASARRPLGGVNKPAGPAAPALPRVTLRTTAVGGVPGVEPGQALNREQLVTAFSTKGQAVSGLNVRGYERYAVATVRTEYPEERMLRRGVSAFTNMNTVESVVRKAQRTHARDNMATEVQVAVGPDGDALTAAGLCAPLETLYDIETVGDEDRPVRDALTRFGAERGGIQWRPALRGVTQTGGIGVWTATDDEADPLVPKTCVEIDCPGVLTAEVDAIYQCLTFSNMSTRFDPEWMDSTIQAQRIAHAKFAENRLLTQLTTASKNVYSTKVLGAVRDTLPTLDRMIAYYRNVHRLNANAPLRWICPLWFRDMLRADIAMQMVGDGLVSLAVADEEMARWFAVRNVNITWHLDGINPPDVDLATDIVTPNQFYALLATNSPVPGFPTPVSTILFREGDWLYLDGGTLDLGVVRDSTLNGENRFQTFSESFETTAFRGVESIHLVLQVQPTGESAATADSTP
jgi:hypothetical protein